MPISFHPLSGIFPVPDERHLRAMAKDIAGHALLEEIVLYQSQILDGRCRYLACERAGVAPRFRQYDGNDPLSFVISRDVNRRHLSKNQRVFAAARAATLPVGSNQAMQSPGLPIGKAAEMFELSERSIARAKTILRHGIPDLVQAVETGKVAVSRAADLCGLTEQEQLAKLREIIERKHTPRKETQKPATGTESTGGNQFGAVQPTQSTTATSNEGAFAIPRPVDRRVRLDDDAAYANLLDAWSKSSKFVMRKFIDEVIREV